MLRKANRSASGSVPRPGTRRPARSSRGCGSHGPGFASSGPTSPPEDRRGRGHRAAGLRGQGARGKRHRRGRGESPSTSSPGEVAHPRPRRRPRHESGRRGGGVHPPFDEQDRDEDDLLSISTLGFRGEALPSVSAVSRLTLRTSEGGAEPGTIVECEAGAILSVGEIAAPRGTTVEVRDLFFNLPGPAEVPGRTIGRAHSGRRVSDQCRARLPRLAARGRHTGGRTVLDCPPVGSSASGFSSSTGRTRWRG